MNIADVYKTIKVIDKDVKTKLMQQGIVPPIKNKDGSICVGRFTIVKNSTGFYDIVDQTNEVIIDGINLPQSAALLANKLALGKFVDDIILNADRNYGHALFEETLQNKLAKKKLTKQDFDSAELLFTKALIAKGKKETNKQVIVRGFEKLIKIV